MSTPHEGACMGLKRKYAAPGVQTGQGTARLNSYMGCHEHLSFQDAGIKHPLGTVLTCASHLYGSQQLCQKP